MINDAFPWVDVYERLSSGRCDYCYTNVTDDSDDVLAGLYHTETVYDVRDPDACVCMACTRARAQTRQPQRTESED
jgi:hypothetical protein